MPLSAADQEVISRMKQRELHLKARQRTANTISYEMRRYRGLFTAATAATGAIVVAGIFVAVESKIIGQFGFWRGTILVLVVGAVFGGLVGHNLLASERGRRRLAAKEAILLRRYRSHLQAGRRWLEFYYAGEDISPYIPQILYAIENEQRFDSVESALAAAKDRHYELDNAKIASRPRELFDSIAAQTNLVVMASRDEAGRPSSRLMNFVRSDQAGRWYLTTAPDSPKVGQFDRGPVALLTAQTASGGTISSNQVQLKRSERTFQSVAELYRAQVPGYVEGMTEDEQQHELVYELTLRSAKVETWMERGVVVFAEPESAIPEPIDVSTTVSREDRAGNP